MQEKVSFMFFSVRMEISLPRDNCFGGSTRQSLVPAKHSYPSCRKFLFAPQTHEIYLYSFTAICANLLTRIEKGKYLENLY